MPRGRAAGVVLAAIVLLFLMTSVRIGSRSVAVVRPLATIPWGRGAGEVALIRAPDGRRFGPPAFIVTGSTLEVLDPGNRRIVTVHLRGGALSRKTAPGVVAMALTPAGMYVADDGRQSVILDGRQDLPYPDMGPGVTRTFELTPLGRSALLLLLHVGPSGTSRGLFVVGPKGYRRLEGQVRSVAEAPRGGYFWSDGETIRSPSGRVVGRQAGELAGADDQGHVAVVTQMGTSEQTVAILPGRRRIRIPDPNWATLGETVEMLPDGDLVLARAEPQGLVFRIVSLRTSHFLKWETLGILKGDGWPWRTRSPSGPRGTGNLKASSGPDITSFHLPSARLSSAF